MTETSINEHLCVAIHAQRRWIEWEQANRLAETPAASRALNMNVGMHQI